MLAKSVSPMRVDQVVTFERSSGPLVERGTTTKTESLVDAELTVIHASPALRAVMRPSAPTVATLVARLVKVSSTPGTGAPCGSVTDTLGRYDPPTSRIRTFSAALPYVTV